ncbi:GNAT family N-acetyltransferase [Microlunatus soli]|uniref:Protein N-acetyltransferase, RimJ/RimL family n=1 Tax=Microlunatus soli TaxID=630515 RepID=A0A1H1Y3U9_9ACTN|nr:GNAT family N-acetyltransferase [Microlunatus soli]SDT16168.1 Protein N-acetyltransferase, RimJ/RimL family [Microlunatus soli]
MDWSGVEGTWWRLRAATRADESAIAAHGRGPDPLWIGIGPAAPAERARQVLTEFLKGEEVAFGSTWLAVVKETDEIVGMIGAQQHPPRTVEIVYGVAPRWRGHGLATEVLAAVTRTAREQDADRRYELIIGRDNAASIRGAEKCDYRYVGARRSLVEATGECYEDLVYLPPW